jgi:ABC-2 type transport system permease protein
MIAELRDGARLYRVLVGARVRSQLQYRASFALNVVTAALLTATDFLVIAVLFEHLPSLAGWSLAEVAFLYGITGMGFALADMSVGHLYDTQDQIRTGDFDVVLLRPAWTLFQMLSADFQLRRLGKALQAFVVFVVALAALDVHWDAGRVAMTFASVIAAAAIFAALYIVGAAVTFWFIGGGEWTASVTYGGAQMASYPMNVFGPWLRRLLGYAAALAFVAYFPALYILDKPDPLGLPGFLRYCSPLAAIVVLVAARALWHVAVRHYRSTGS